MISFHTTYDYFKTPLQGRVVPHTHSPGEDNEDLPQATDWTLHKSASTPVQVPLGLSLLVKKLKAKMKIYTNIKMC